MPSRKSLEKKIIWLKIRVDEMKRFDVLIIGAGAVGNAVAREISKNRKITVGILEKEPDTGFGISGRNSGVLHAGFNNVPGSLMAKLCVQGSEGFTNEAKELGIRFKRTGKLVIARFEEDRAQLLRLKSQGEANGVRELSIIEADELERLAGYPAGVAALWSGMTGIFDPFEYTTALAEAASSQGCRFFFGRKVISIENNQSLYTNKQASMKNQQTLSNNKETRDDSDFTVTTTNLQDGATETYFALVLINCAGLWADEICRMAGIEDHTIYPCRGEYHVLDRRDSTLPEIPIYPIPNEKDGGLGVHLTPTVDGNLMIGPSAEYLPEGMEREEYGTTGEVMKKLKEEGSNLLPTLEKAGIIRSFAGIRPKLVSQQQGGYGDFLIEESRKVPGMIQLVGIESPGLTASIPIAKVVAKMADEILSRSAPLDHRDSPVEEEKSTPSNEDYKGDQRMLCRCEGITEAAVLAAYDRILRLGAIPTIKGLKNRTRVTMGNCQGSFCTLNLIDVLKEKRGIDPLKLLWSGFGSTMLMGEVRK